MGHVEAIPGCVLKAGPILLTHAVGKVCLRRYQTPMAVLTLPARKPGPLEDCQRQSKIVSVISFVHGTTLCFGGTRPRADAVCEACDWEQLKALLIGFACCAFGLQFWDQTS